MKDLWLEFLSVVMAVTGAGQETITIQLGPRPFYLVDTMKPGPLKAKLESCSEMQMRSADFSIGHRGAPLQFPEHTRESYVAAARMGAGLLECDVTFTSDEQLVCRHGQCDLHTTTNILARPELAGRCRQQFSPYNPQTGELAKAECCSSDYTLAEIKSLCGKMDGFNPQAVTVREYLAGTPGYRTDLYAQCGSILSHSESITLFKELGVKMIPELKVPQVRMPFGKLTAATYPQKLVDEYKKAGVRPEHVWLQSFQLKDIRYWIKTEPEFGKRAVYLDGRYTQPNFKIADATTWQPTMLELRQLGLTYLAPPIWMLLTVDNNGKLVASEYAKRARAAGLELIGWSMERSGPLSKGGGWYYQTSQGSIKSDGDVYQALRVLSQDIGVRGVFSDWPATVTYYANCMGLQSNEHL